MYKITEWGFSLFLSLLFIKYILVLSIKVRNTGTMVHWFHMSRVMRKPDFCTCENKDADQLRGNREADQLLCFRYIDSTIPLLSKSEISRL